MVTAFKNYNETHAPFHRPAEDILRRIKEGKYAAEVERRAESFLANIIETEG